MVHGRPGWGRYASRFRTDIHACIHPSALIRHFVSEGQACGTPLGRRKQNLMAQHPDVNWEVGSNEGMVGPELSNMVAVRACAELAVHVKFRFRVVTGPTEERSLILRLKLFLFYSQVRSRTV